MMVPRRILAGCALIGLGVVTNAQGAEALDSTSFKRVTPVKHMVYDFANRKVVRNGSPQKAAIATFCYINTDTVGIFTSISPGSELIDWGILGGTATTKCAGISPIATNFNFAYATSSVDTSVGGPGAALTLTFYTGFQGFGADSGNCPVATFAFTGLPGFSGSSTGIGAGFGFTVDVSGGGEFCLPTGAFGFGYSSPEVTGTGFAVSGPISCFSGDGSGGLEPCTGNLDAIDLWAPDTKGVNTGTVFFGGPPVNFTSWYLQVARADLSSSPAAVGTRNCPPNQANSLMCTTGVLGGAIGFTAQDTLGYAACILIAFDTPFKIALGGGQVLLCLDFGGSGELLTGGGLSMTPLGAGAFNASAPLPKNVDFCGFVLCVQGLLAFGVTPFALTNACDLTLGG